MAITHFIPEVWSANLLLPLRNQLVYGGAGVINRDYEGEIARAGDTVHITDFTDPAVRPYVRNETSATAPGDVANIQWDVLSDGDRVLTVDQADYFAFTVDDLDKRQAQPGFVAATTTGASYNLSATADTYLSGLMISAAGNSLPDVDGVTTTTSGDMNNVYDKILVPMRTALKRANAPVMGRWVIVPPEIYAFLLLDKRFIRSDDAPGTTLQSGLVGRAAGFDIYESNTVPTATVGTTGGADNGFTILAGHGMATTFAQQIASVEAVRLQNTFGDGVKGLHLYGAKVVRPTLLVKCNVSAAA